MWHWHSPPPKRTTLTFIFICCGSLTAGCTNTRVGDAMMPATNNAMWEDGQTSVATGEAMITQGESRLAEGRKHVRDGEVKIRDGSQRMLQARVDYQAAVSSSSGSTTPEDSDAESARLTAIGKRWEKAIADIKAGNALVAKGNKLIDKAQTEIREGRMLMETGSVLMRNAQRSRLGKSPLPMPRSER